MLGRHEEAFINAAIAVSLAGASAVQSAQAEAWESLFEASLARDDFRFAGVALDELMAVDSDSPKRREREIALQRLRGPAAEREQRRREAEAAADPLARAIFADEYVIPEID